MQYKKYQHIEKLGREEVEGLLNGTVYCFPKIDGTNSCLFLDDEGKLCAGSRNRQLTLEKDNAGFYAYALQHPEYKAYLEAHPTHILYGEWLVKHTIKTYKEDAWRKFYVFDVFEVNPWEDSPFVEIDEEDGITLTPAALNPSRYIPYDEYGSELEKYGIEYIPVMAILKTPTVYEIAKLAKENHYLMPNDTHIGEGIVCKNYKYANKYGRVTWGKLVAEEFFEKKQKLKSDKPEVKSDFEEKIALEYITDAVVKKEYAKVKREFPEVKKNELIGRVLNAVYDSFITEDLVTVVHKSKTCTINFRYMKKQSDNRVKEVLKDELF